MDYMAQKQLLLNQILENTQAQTSAIEGDKVERMESLIAQREVFIKQIDELGHSVDDDTEAIKEVLRRIITIDNGNRSLMKEGLEGIKGEILKIRAGRLREGSYGSEHGLYKEEGIFFDTKK